MRSEHRSILTVVAGVLSLGIGGCSGSDTGTVGSGGSSSVANASGGAASGGASVVPATGGSSVGATGGSTSVSTVVETGGAATGGAATGVAPATGGKSAAAGGSATGGKSSTGGSTAVPTGGTPSTGGAGSGGTTAQGGGSATTGGRTGVGGTSAATGGRTATGGASTTSTTGGATSTGTCVASKATGTNVSGTGPHKVTVETNADTGISEGTIFRPTDLGGTEKYPIFVWGEGGCSLNGLSNSAAMAEIASHGYFVIADGTPNNTASRSMDTSNPAAMGKPLLNYVTWAIAENEKPCSAYYHSMDTTKVSANGFSCGGLMAEGTAGDPRISTWGLNSSGLFASNAAFYKTIHTPVLLVLGGTSDMAYQNGENDYTNISALNIPIMLFSKDLGHGGDLFSSHGGDFTKIDLAWLNWWLKGDLTATGKGLLVGSGCTYCTNSAWEVKSKNLP